jgi:hypothetical protein
VDCAGYQSGGPIESTGGVGDAAAIALGSTSLTIIMLLTAVGHLAERG